MTRSVFPRHVGFEKIFNFRDLGGYRTRDGRQVAWRRLFRSAEIRHMTARDAARLRDELNLASIIDLRSNLELEKQGVGMLPECGFQYHRVPFVTREDEGEKGPERFLKFSNMGEVYLYFIRQPEYGRHIVDALEIIARPEKHPLLFHCAAGKDRTGILAAVILSVLGVSEPDIIEEYTLTAPYMRELRARLDRDPNLTTENQELPDYMWEAAANSMALFLSTLKREYGSVKKYLIDSGGKPRLFEDLEKALLS